MSLGYPPIIIPNKGKRTDYYPAFDSCRITGRFDDFTELLVGLLIESFYKRINFYQQQKLSPYPHGLRRTMWQEILLPIKRHGGTIPAFHIREKWMIVADFKEG